MRKIIFLILVFCVAVSMLHSAYTDTIVSSGINTTYKRIMFVYADSLLDTIAPIYMGNQQASPLSMSTTDLRVLSDNNLSFRNENNYIESSATDYMGIIAEGTLTITVPTGSKFYLGTVNNYITEDNLTLGGNLGCANATLTGTATVPTVACTTATISGSSTIGETLGVTGILTATGGLVGDVAGNVTSTGTSAFTNVTASGTSTFATITLTGEISSTRASGSGIDITSDGSIGGDFDVTGTSGLTGITSAIGGIKTDAIAEYTLNNGLTVEAVGFLDGNITLNGVNHYIAFDLDDDTYLYGKSTDDNLFVHIGGADDFQFTEDTFTAISGSTIKSNTISETTSNQGVTVDGMRIEQKASIQSFLPSTSIYTAFCPNDTTSNPTSHSLTDKDDVYIGGILEVDGLVYLDGTVTCAGTVNLETLSFSGTSPEISPKAWGSSDGTDFIIHGGDGDANGGDLFLDGGNATADGDVILGDRDGNVSINSPLLFAEYATLNCVGTTEAADLTETINYIIITANDTITVADGVEGQTICFITEENSTTFEAHIQEVSSNFYFGTEIKLDSKTAACELIFHKTHWYIKSITD